MCPGMFAATWDKPAHSEVDDGYVCAKCGEFQVSWDQRWKCRSQGKNKRGVFCLFHCSVDQIQSTFVCSAEWLDNDITNGKPLYHESWRTQRMWVGEECSCSPLNLPQISGWRWDRQSRRRRHLLLSVSPTVCLMQTIAPSLQRRAENEEQSLWTSFWFHRIKMLSVGAFLYFGFRKLISDISKILPNMFRWHFLWNCLLFPADISKPSRTF